MNTFRFADMHCDTIVCKVERAKGAVALRKNNAQLDLERLKAAGALVQCFALFIPSGEAGDKERDGLDHYDYFLAAHACYEREMEANKDIVAKAFCYDDVLKNERAGKLSALLTIEDGLLLEGSLERLNAVYEKSVRLITLTWNTENTLGYPNYADRPDTERGLKPFGISAVEHMNALGVIVDVSHLSDAGFYDVAKHAKKPFVASHSNARAVFDVPRNLTDDMLKILADKGGMTGLNFAPYFLDGAKVTHIDALLDHAAHIVNVAGEEALGFGSDFDGIDAVTEFGGCEGFPLLLERFLPRFTPRQVEKFASGNFLRVLRACL